MNKSCKLIRAKLIQFGASCRHYCRFSGAFSGSLYGALPTLRWSRLVGLGVRVGGLPLPPADPDQYATEHSRNPVTTPILPSLWCIISKWVDISRLSALPRPATVWALFGWGEIWGWGWGPGVAAGLSPLGLSDMTFFVLNGKGWDFFWSCDLQVPQRNANETVREVDDLTS